MMMKRAMVFMVMALLVTAGSAWAVRGPQKVEYTPHNFSTSANNLFLQYKANNEDEICVFCHTPHGGSLDGPLWNRSDSGTAYRMYWSETLSSETKAARPVNEESIICLSCHDGSIGVGDLINRSGSTPSNQNIPVKTGFDFRFGTVPGPQLGASFDELVNSATESNDDLRDDHPISFSYSAVVAEKSSDFNPTVAVANDLLLFGADNRVECSTCHDPHVNYIDGTVIFGFAGFPGADGSYAPFLRMPNGGSGMCLACHIK